MLSLRLPIPISTALPFVLEVDKNHTDSLTRATSLLWAIGQIYSDPKVMKDFNVLLRETNTNDLDQMLLAACRIPGLEKDEYVVSKNVRHVLVINKNRIFTADILDEDNRVISAGLIFKQLECILDHVEQSDTNPLALTALPRNVWYTTRLDLLKDKSTKTNIKRAESAIVSITLEEESSPSSLGDVLEHIRLGKPGSRYYDKLVNVVVYSDGQAGILIDHTCSDGYVAGKMCMLISELARKVDTSPQDANIKPESCHISTTGTNTSTYIWVNKDRDVSTFEMSVSSDLLHILKMSHVRDAWLHLSLQLAIRELTGTLSFLIGEPTYIDNYENGGTEPTFPLTTQSRELITQIVEGSPFGSKITSLKSALVEHRRLIKNTKEGKGCGPHINVLNALLKLHVPGHPILRYLERLGIPDVVMTGASEGAHLLKAAAGNVFAENQLIVTYLLKENEIVFVLTARGRFSTMLPNIPKTLTKSLNELLSLIVSHVSAETMLMNCVPDIMTSRYAGEAKYSLYLPHNPNTLGTIILQHHDDPNRRGLQDNADEFLSFMMNGKYVALRLQTQLGVKRCAMIGLFLPNDKPHIHIIPFYGLEKDWISVIAKKEECSPVYKGYVTTVEGPRVAAEELTLVQQNILGSEKVQGWNNSFHGDSTDESVFACLVRVELSQWRVWEDDDHVAFLTPFPNTPGFTVVIPRSHLSSDITSLSEDDFRMLFMAVYQVATQLMSSLSADGCAVVCEGMEIDYAHVKVIPLHHVMSGDLDVQEEFHETYPGFISTKPGPGMDTTTLIDIATKLTRS